MGFDDTSDTYLWSCSVQCYFGVIQCTVKPVFKTTWEIRTTWELRTAISIPRSIHYIEMDLRNKTTSEFRTVLTVRWVSLIPRFHCTFLKWLVLDKCQLVLGWNRLNLGPRDVTNTFIVYFWPYNVQWYFEVIRYTYLIISIMESRGCVSMGKSGRPSLPRGGGGGGLLFLKNGKCSHRQ